MILVAKIGPPDLAVILVWRGPVFLPDWVHSTSNLARADFGVADLYPVTPSVF